MNVHTVTLAALTISWRRRGSVHKPCCRHSREQTSPPQARFDRMKLSRKRKMARSVWSACLRQKPLATSLTVFAFITT